MNGSRAKFYLERLLEKKEIQLAMRERIVQYFVDLRRAVRRGEVGRVPDLANFIQIHPQIGTITIQVYFEHNWKSEEKKLMFDGIEKFVRPYINGAVVLPAKGVVVCGDPDPHQTHKTIVNSIRINVKEIPKAAAIRSQSSRIKCSECEGSSVSGTSGYQQAKSGEEFYSRCDGRENVELFVDKFGNPTMDYPHVHVLHHSSGRVDVVASIARGEHSWRRTLQNPSGMEVENAIAIAQTKI